ncbi:MAG: dUTP diphosphatase [Planctomycetota bacterium]
MSTTRPAVLHICTLRDTAVVPEYKSEHAAGMDLSAAPADGLPVTIPPGGIAKIPCGFSMALTPGYEAQVRPRSGLASKFGVTLPNAPGTIDADYRGEVVVPLINLGSQAFVVEPGMRIAQMVIAPVAHATVVVVDDAQQLGATARGAGGFGSTGI